MDAKAMTESDIMFSSLDEELISDIKRPSLISLTSEDSRGSEEDRNVPSDYGPINYNIAASSPLKDDTDEDYHFKIPSNFPSARDGKRFSLTSYNDNTCAYNINKSNSLHDVSSIASFSPLRRDSSCMYSTETLQSNSIATTKSKDSGFQRSTSCSSLTTNGSKKYDHVQSKVKQYIQTIKESEALHKMQKRLQDSAYRKSRESFENFSLDSPETSPVTNIMPVSKKELLDKVKELEEEIKEKDCVIEQLEKNHSELRLKYAAAETHIDDLRIRVSQDEEPMNYISDEKVAELLTNNAKNPRRYTSSPIIKPVIKTEANLVPYEIDFARSGVRELQPIKKFCSNSIKLNETYPVLKSKNLLKSSSCKYVKECNYELSKSASNIDKACVGFVENDMLSYSRAKVQQWQRSLVNLSQADESQMEVCYPSNEYESRRCCVHDDGPMDDASKKSRRYLKNKDAEKKNYRKSYPVGCKCEKYKKIKDEPKPARKLMRSVSFASYEESMTSSMYDDESSSDSSAVVVPKHESYKIYKQRKLQEKYEQRTGRRSPKWSEIKKAKSASNIHKDAPHRNKRLIDNVSTSYEYSCSERKQCVKPHKSKYRKLDDCSKVPSAGCNVMKCRSAHSCQSAHRPYLLHSKSYDACARSHERDHDRRLGLDNLECSCLTALEKLKIQEHQTLTKFAEHIKKHSRVKTQDKWLPTRDTR